MISSIIRFIYATPQRKIGVLSTAGFDSPRRHTDKQLRSKPPELPFNCKCLCVCACVQVSLHVLSPSASFHFVCDGGEDSELKKKKKKSHSLSLYLQLPPHLTLSFAFTAVKCQTYALTSP